MKRIIFWGVLLIFLCYSISTYAEHSLFISREEWVLETESDGSMSIFVEFEFQNIGENLDYVNIGLPSNNFSINDIQVELNGKKNTNIIVSKANYTQSGLFYGITLDMNESSIPSGESGTMSIIIPNLEKNLFQANSENKTEFVGFHFQPEIFLQNKLVEGTTDLFSFIIVFPEGADADQVYYYSPENWAGQEEPTAWIDEDNRVVYEWANEFAMSNADVIFGGKFPADVLTSTGNIVSAKESSTFPTPTVVSPTPYVNEYEKPIKFRNIDWGSNYYEVVAAMPDAEFSNHQFYLFDYSIEDMLFTESLFDPKRDSFFRGLVGDLGYRCNVSFPDLKQDFDNLFLYFVYTTDENGQIIEDDAHTALVFAEYFYAVGSENRYNDLLQRLTSLYGEVDVYNNKVSGWNTFEQNLWAGADGTMVSLVTSHDVFEKYQYININYGYTGANELIENAYKVRFEEYESISDALIL